MNFQNFHKEICIQRFIFQVDEMDIDNSVVTPLSEENEYVSVSLPAFFF